MRFVTIWSRQVKRRKGPMKGKTETVWGQYETKTLTAAHKRLHASTANAETWFAPTRIVTHFCPGIPLDAPIVSGGFRVNL